jgi:hypothetical protein
VGEREELQAKPVRCRTLRFLDPSSLHKRAQKAMRRGAVDSDMV